MSNNETQLDRVAERTPSGSNGQDRDSELLLDIRDLKVEFHSREGHVQVLRGVDLEVYPGETLAIVGESGCGKSMTARSVLGIIPNPGRVVNGSITYYPTGSENPIELTTLPVDGKEIRRVRGGEIAMIFQEPMTSLSPVHTIGNQIMEAIRLHVTEDPEEQKRRAIEALGLVGIPNPSSRINDYPFQLSGGMRQRVMLAMAISSEPKILLADEPTTALDVTIQAQMLGLLRRLQRELGLSVVLITHNLGVVAATADRVAVMYMGRVVEEASVNEIFANPKHPYTRGLMESIPKVGEAERRKLVSIPGNVPDMRADIPGCPFHPRCSEAIAGVCDVIEPGYHEVATGHTARCVLYGDESERRPPESRPVEVNEEQE